MKSLAHVKKYNSIFNLIIATIASMLLGSLTFLAFQLDSTSDKIDFWFYFDLIFSFVIFITLFAFSIRVFIKQTKFNKSTPKYYITLADNKSLCINSKQIAFENIVNISYKKIHKWEVFGEINENHVGETTIPVFKYEEKIAEKSSQKAKNNYNKAVNKSNLGNIIIELESSKIVLKRVDNVEETVKEIKKIIKGDK